MVPQAAMPGVDLPGVAALQTPIELLPLARSNTLTASGIFGVSALAIKSFRTEIETRPSGVTRQEQHEISCPLGSNV